MKALFSTAFLSLVVLAFAGTEKNTVKQDEFNTVTCMSVYQDTIPKRDTMHKKDKKKDKREKRDTMQTQRF
jgi:hypothetical protein